MRPLARHCRRREDGAALLVSMMVLALIGALGISSLEIVMRDQQVAGFQARKRISLQAAEAGVEDARGQLAAGSPVPNVLLTNLADAATYPMGQPSYGPDTSGTAPVTDLGAQVAPGMNLRIDGNAGPKFQIQLWRLRVEGTEPAGIISRIETTASVFKGN